MPPRRRQATEASKARAQRIANALAGLLEDVPDAPEFSGGDPYRGAELPPKKKDSVASLTCPACEGVMEIEDQRGIEIHRCGACDGLWLDPGELDDLVDAPPAAAPDVAQIREEMRKVAPPVGEVRYRMCPRCGDPMNRQNYGSHSGVVIDECRRHGLYLDAHEFEAIETFIRMGGLDIKRKMLEERARKRELTARAAEADAAAREHGAAAVVRHRHWLLGGFFDLF